MQEMAFSRPYILTLVWSAFATQQFLFIQTPEKISHVAPGFRKDFNCSKKKTEKLNNVITSLTIIFNNTTSALN